MEDSAEDSALALTFLSIQCASAVQGRQKMQNRKVNYTVRNHTVRRCKLPRSPSGVHELYDEVDERGAEMTIDTRNEVKDNDMMYVLLDRVRSLREEQMKKISTLEEENTVLRNGLQVVRLWLRLNYASVISGIYGLYLLGSVYNSIFALLFFKLNGINLLFFDA